MSLRSVSIGFRRGFHQSRLAQIGCIMLFWLLGEFLVRTLRLPLPGGIVGLALALALMSTGRLSVFSLRRGATWLLDEMLLFFVPAMLAVTEHHEFFGLLGLKILVVIFVGTLVVMSVTALTVDLFLRWGARHDVGVSVSE